MGTCKIVGWCGNQKCVEGCLAQKAVEAEREACKADCRNAAEVAQEMYGFDAECIATVDECLRIIDERHNVELTGGASAPSSDRRERG